MSDQLPMSLPAALETPEARLRRGRRILLGMAILAIGLTAIFILVPHDPDDESRSLRTGDCFQNTGTKDNPIAHRLNCSDADADYRVLKAVKGSVSGILTCSDVEGATGSLTAVGAKSYVVCFTRN